MYGNGMGGGEGGMRGGGREDNGMGGREGMRGMMGGGRGEGRDMMGGGRGEGRDMMRSNSDLMGRGDMMAGIQVRGSLALGTDFITWVLCCPHHLVLSTVIVTVVSALSLHTVTCPGHGARHDAGLP